MGQVIAFRKIFLLIAGALINADAFSVSPKDGCVVLTGVNGFLAGHIAEILLEKGYVVHGTLRLPTFKRPGAVEHLRKMEARLPGKLLLFPVPDMVHGPGIYDEAAQGCAAFIATSFYRPANEEIQKLSKEMADDLNAYQVNSGINGTLAAIDAAVKFGFKKIVQTSSAAACSPTKAKGGQMYTGPPYTENDWQDLSRPGFLNYFHGKTMAERTLYDWKARHISGPMVASILFAVASGPLQQKRISSSTAYIAGLLKGEMGFFYMPQSFWVVDVRDVARAHVHVMEHEGGQGRFIISPTLDAANGQWSLGQLAKLLAKHFPDYPLPTVQMPVWMFSKIMNSGLPGTDPGFMHAVNVAPGFDGTKIVRELGFEYKYTDLKKSLLETAQSIIDSGRATPAKNLSPILVFSSILTLVSATSFALGAFVRACCFKKTILHRGAKAA